MNYEQENIFQEFWLQGHDRDWNGHVGSVDIHKMADEIIKLRTLLSLCSNECEDLHHNKEDLHATFSEDCPIVARINTALKRNI